MAPFRRVEGEQAGPSALGILVPPSRRTFLILRPRALAWDLLLVRRLEAPAFWELAHDEATAAAQGVYRALSQTRPEISVMEDPQRGSFWVRVAVGPFAFAACTRVPGQPYQPLACEAQPAGAAAGALAAALCPAEGAAQEVYFNTRFFQAPSARP
jgi:hypothetical protein